MQKTYTFWANVRTGTGSFMQVRTRAPGQYQAQKIFENQYGDNLISNAAMINEPTLDRDDDDDGWPSHL